MLLKLPAPNFWLAGKKGCGGISQTDRQEREEKQCWEEKGESKEGANIST